MPGPLFGCLRRAPAIMRIHLRSWQAPNLRPRIDPFCDERLHAVAPPAAERSITARTPILMSNAGVYHHRGLQPCPRRGRISASRVRAARCGGQRAPAMVSEAFYAGGFKPPCIGLHADPVGRAPLCKRANYHLRRRRHARPRAIARAGRPAPPAHINSQSRTSGPKRVKMATDTVGLVRGRPICLFRLGAALLRRACARQEIPYPVLSFARPVGGRPPRPPASRRGVRGRIGASCATIPWRAPCCALRAAPRTVSSTQLRVGSAPTLMPPSGLPTISRTDLRSRARISERHASHQQSSADS